MAQELPYLPSYKNVAVLFEKAKSAKIPEVFSQKYLQETIGLKASGDRPLINLLKQLGFLDGSGRPTPRYSSLKNEKIAGIEIARGIKDAYRPLFDANENANTLDGAELKGLVAQVSGADSGTTTKIIGTLKALLSIADFASNNELDKDNDIDSVKRKKNNATPVVQIPDVDDMKKLRPEFHYNFQIHLPSNGSEETYTNIFNAIRKVFN